MLEGVSPFNHTCPTDLLLLRSTSANSLCVTELLTDIQSATTTLSLSNIVGLITEAISGTTVGIPQNVTCSNCSQAAYTIVAQDFPGLLTSEESTIQSECGSSFTGLCSDPFLLRGYTHEFEQMDRCLPTSRRLPPTPRARRVELPLFPSAALTLVSPC
jgi:hypothetical protein